MSEQLASARSVVPRPALEMENSRPISGAWWQDQGIEPLTDAATLWAKTHPVAPAEAEIVGDTDQSARINTRLNR